MTRPVPNMNAPLVDKTLRVVPPWNSWFQQFTQAPAASAGVTVGASPFSFTANNIGQVIVSGGTVSNIALVRGTVIINLFTSTASPRAILVSIGDTVIVTYSVLPTIQFLEL